MVILEFLEDFSREGVFTVDRRFSVYELNPIGCRIIISAVTWLCSYEPLYYKPFHCWFWITFSLLISKIYRIEHVVESFTGLVFIQDAWKWMPIVRGLFISVMAFENCRTSVETGCYLEYHHVDFSKAQEWTPIGRGIFILKIHWTLITALLDATGTLGQKAGSVELIPPCGCGCCTHGLCHAN